MDLTSTTCDEQRLKGRGADEEVFVLRNVVSACTAKDEGASGHTSISERVIVVLHCVATLVHCYNTISSIK